MIKYDLDIISRILKTEEFDLDKLDLNQIKHVPMHQYRVASDNQPLLLIDNLQVCVGLYAYSKNFGFGAHLNPVVIRGDEFRCDSKKNIIYCNRIDELYNAIIDANINDTIYIGISIGFNPVSETFNLVWLLNNSIDDLIVKLKDKGIEVVKLDLKDNHIFIIDTINEQIITPVNQINSIKHR